MRRILAPSCIRQSLRVVLMVMFLAGLSACTSRSAVPIASQENLPTLAPFATVTPPRPAISTSTPEPPSTSTPTQLPTATITPSPLIDLPAPLYMLVDFGYSESGRLLVLRPGEKAVDPVWGGHEHITCFDVSPVDGRLAFGLDSGWLVVEASGSDSEILINTSKESPYPVSINGISWSPDGKRLAYTVDFEDHNYANGYSKYPTPPSGVWVVDIENPQPVWLLSNHYLGPEVSVSEFSIFYDPVWSPDGQALKVRHGRYDYLTTLWFYPVEPEMEIRDDRQTAENNASWTTDSKALLVSSYDYSDIGHLTLLPRDGREARKLIDGPEAAIQIIEPFVLDSGIAFSAYRYGDGQIPYMFYGKMEGETFQWYEMEQNPLCMEYYVQAFAHHTGEDVITLLCGKTSLRLIQPAANTFTEIDLTPFMEKVKGRVIQIHWGVD